ncbi:MAG: HAMP domain-containing histidine kinase, partial [Bacteroidetes bacterium]|nr:HAMP domain-containing histidine kinase [Bacteroidota bacterium]
SVIVLIIAIPMLYFAVQRAVKEDADESLAFRKNELEARLKTDESFLSESDLRVLATGIAIAPLPSFFPHDSIYDSRQYDSASQEILPYRVMESNVVINAKPYRLTLKDSLVDTEDLIGSIVKTAALILLCIVAGLYLINRYISKQTWKPFYGTLEKLNSFRVDDSEPIQLPPSNVSEFADLNKAIENLTSTNQRVYQSQKEFTENASHEMQTPLAVLQGKIDLLMQTSPLTEEQSELIGGLANAGRRMSRLNKSLLLLTKIENNQFAETENIPVKETIDKLMEQYRCQAEQKNIAIQTSLVNGVALHANKSLVEIMFANFLSNAIKHNCPNGTAHINGNMDKISFSNTSHSAQLNTDRMFQRFQKQTNDTGSIGLGLQIAKKIADHYHYRVDYFFQDSRHVFTIAFK